MKKVFLSLVVMGLFTACSTSDNETLPVAPQVGEISGTITSNQTFPSGIYTLKGIVKINSGVTVTFNAGSTITCDIANGDNALVVLNGGKIKHQRNG